MADEVNQDTLVSGSHRVIGGRYVLERELGRGGMGTVWRASQLGVGNTVAIKFLNEVLSADPGVVKRFEQEAKVSLEVTHPGASQLLDTGRDPKTGQLYIVFEYVEGEDLRTRLTRDGALPFDEARDIALRVGEVLAAAHARGVVHRDIKPENIRLRRDLGGTHVKVLDFGIASFRPEANGRLTAEGAIAGTPAYMAPEQVRAEQVDGRADIYALGLVTFEMMTGVPAFTSNSAAALLVDQLSTPLPSAGVSAPHRPFPALDEVLQRACAKDPRHRLGSAKDFVDAIKRLPTPAWAGPAAPGPNAPPRATGFIGAPMAAPSAPTVEPTTSRAGLAVVAALGLAGLAGLGAYFVKRPPVATCTLADAYDPELRALPAVALEARLTDGRLMPPSLGKRQLAAMKATANTQGDDCRYRVMLLSALTSARTAAASSPEAFGQTRDEKALEMLLLSLPLTPRWTVAQARDVLAQLDAAVDAETRATPEDAPYWKRHHYGVVLLCSVTDEALEQLKAGRPASCPTLEPRAAP